MPRTTIIPKTLDYIQRDKGKTVKVHSSSFSDPSGNTGWNDLSASQIFQMSNGKMITDLEGIHYGDRISFTVPPAPRQTKRPIAGDYGPKFNENAVSAITFPVMIFEGMDQFALSVYIKLNSAGSMTQELQIKLTNGATTQVLTTYDIATYGLFAQRVFTTRTISQAILPIANDGLAFVTLSINSTKTNPRGAVTGSTHFWDGFHQVQLKQFIGI